MFERARPRSFSVHMQTSFYAFLNWHIKFGVCVCVCIYLFGNFCRERECEMEEYFLCCASARVHIQNCIYLHLMTSVCNFSFSAKIHQVLLYSLLHFFLCYFFFLVSLSCLSGVARKTFSVLRWFVLVK